MKKVLLSLAMVVSMAVFCAPAFATNGDNIIGVGTISRSMGGVGAAAPQDPAHLGEAPGRIGNRAEDQARDHGVEGAGAEGKGLGAGPDQERRLEALPFAKLCIACQEEEEERAKAAKALIP